MSRASDVPDVRRTTVPVEPLPGLEHHDYADAFTMRLGEPDARSAEQWARAALEGAPAWMRTTILLAHRGLLRFRPADGPPQILGWRVSHSEHDVVRLDASGPLLRATIVARRGDSRSATVATYLWFLRPVTRALWVVVGPVHRAFVPRLLRHAAERGAAAG